MSGRARAERPTGAPEQTPDEPALRLVIEIVEDGPRSVTGWGWLGATVCVCAVLHFGSLGFAIAFGACLGLSIPLVAWLRP
jgi:hypothetical protein